MMTDPIADLLTRLRNAALVQQREVRVPHSKIKRTIAEILVREGYLARVTEGPDRPPMLVIALRYTANVPAIQHLKRVSTPGHRRYVKHADIKPVLNGLGMAILSTPRGVVTDREAREAGVGGEIICEVY